MFRRLLFMLVLLCLPSLASATTVYQTRYSGQLSESGTPVNGNRYVQLAVYNVASGGAPIHTQAESLAFVGGVYHTVLATDPALWDGSDRWVGVSINGGLELAPRLYVSWVPNAVYAALAKKLANPPLAGSSNNTSIIFVTTTSWTKIDSVSFTTSGLGNTVLTASGYVEPNGNGLEWGIQYAITPDEFPSHLSMAGFDAVANATRPIMPFSLTQLFPVYVAGPQKYYLWAKMSGGSVQSLHHRAPMVYTFTPTP